MLGPVGVNAVGDKNDLREKSSHSGQIEDKVSLDQRRDFMAVRGFWDHGLCLKSFEGVIYL